MRRPRVRDRVRLSAPHLAQVCHHPHDCGFIVLIHIPLNVNNRKDPAWLRELPAVDVLRRVLVQNCTRTITRNGREVIRRREKEPEGHGLPPGHARIASPYAA